MRKLILFSAASIFVLPAIIICFFSILILPFYPDLLSKGLTLKFWGNIIQGNSLFLDSVINSIIIGIVNGILSSLIGLMTARAIHCFDIRLGRWARYFSAIPLFIPSMTLYISVHTMFIRIGLINSIAGVVLAHMLVTIPYTTNIFIAYFKGLPKDIENAARTLGGNMIIIFRKILLPLFVPGLWLSFSIGFLISFSEYFSTFLIGGGRILSLAGLLYPYVTNGDTNNAAVLGVIFIAVNAAVFGIAGSISKRKMRISNYLFGSI
jgi:putative spermidine/putrescine transport system permease protein